MAEKRKRPVLQRILLIWLFWPFILVWLAAKRLANKQERAKKSGPKPMRPKLANKEQPAASKEVVPAKGASKGGLVESMLIPEPTKSLLFVTDEDPAKIQHAGAITMNLNVSTGEITRQENGFFAEPSLIWTRLAVKPNNWLEEKAMYWPSYSLLSPEHRYQYLRWLRDIEEPTNLSYVFLYFYGLERHMLVGDYDEAVDEILRLLKAHNKGSFRSYATSSLIVASIFRKKLDYIVEKAPFLLEEEVDESLALRIHKGTSMTPEDMISIASRVGFTNKRYIKQQPELFNKHLQAVIDEFEKDFGPILSNFKLADFRMVNADVFANTSIPERFRRTKVPQILQNAKFKKVISNALNEAHQRVKKELHSK